MRYLTAVGRFLYGLFIGDDWKITAGVVASLVVGRLLLSTSLPAAGVAVVIGVLLAAMFFATVVVDARRPRR